MKSLERWLPVLAAGTLLFGGSLFAQDLPATTSSASYATPQGKLTIHSEPAPAPVIGPAPAFEQLSGGGKAISEAQAVAYPALANDFIHADSNRDGSVSKAEYTRWTRQL